jgi:CBS domain-containing protein
MTIETHKLRVHTRNTILNDGGSSTEMTVYCPHQQQTIEVGECVECVRRQDISAGTVTCRAEGSTRPQLQKAGGCAHWITDSVPIGSVMTRNVTCVAAGLPTDSLAALLIELGASGVPVVDEDGAPIGLVSKTDLVRERVEGDESVDIVANIMTPIAFTLDEHAPISKAAALMALEGVHQLPVVSSEGRVVGLLTSMDVLRWLARQSGYAFPER